MGRLIRQNYWLPCVLSSQLVHGDAPLPVRLLGEDYVAFAGDSESHSWMTSSRVPCNWVQGVEGTIDSAPVGILHQDLASRLQNSPSTPTRHRPRSRDVQRDGVHHI